MTMGNCLIIFLKLDKLIPISASKDVESCNTQSLLFNVIILSQVQNNRYK